MNATTPITGSCHCGAVRFRLDVRGDDTTICNCSACRRYGAIWAYGWLGRTVRIDAAPDARVAYVHGDRDLAFHHCATCGCVTDWTGLRPQGTGPHAEEIRCAVNLRLADPAAVADVPLRRFDGAGRFEELPADGRCIRDIVV